jgi:DNA uptake protein ComE-like DNA-binding protein
MKDKLRDLFTFSSDERKGIIALVFVLIVICTTNIILMLHHPQPPQSGYPSWMKDSGSYEISDYDSPSNNDLFMESYNADVADSRQKTIIDPNTASLEKLILTGFSLRISRTIIRYREKGGRFKTTDDLKKIYGLTPEMFQSVEAYLKITDEDEPVSLPRAPTSISININTADSAAFEKLPGIGPVLARRIIRYRKVLGGYYSVGQIREVYGVTDSLFLLVSDKLKNDTTDIKKINLNTADEKELARHPYIGKYTAAGIEAYRNHVGKILKTNELIFNGLVPEDRFDKLKYYISL